MSSISLKMSMPNTDALPLLGSNNPVSIDMVVVLPAPLWPRSANIYPLYIVMLVLSTATLVPNSFLSPLILRHSLLTSYLLRISGTASKSSGFLFSSMSGLTSELMSSDSAPSCTYLLSGLLFLRRPEHQKFLVQRKYHFFATPY